MSHDMPPGCTVGSCIAFPRRDFSLLAEKERRLAGLMEGKMVVFVIDAAAPDDDELLLLLLLWQRGGQRLGKT